MGNVTPQKVREMVEEDNHKHLKKVIQSEEAAELIHHKYEQFFHDTLLHVAGRNNAVECCRMLLEAGVEQVASDRGWTPLHSCAYNGSPEVAKLLLDAGGTKHLSACTSVDGDDGVNPLHMTLEYAGLLEYTKEDLENLEKRKELFDLLLPYYRDNDELDINQRSQASNSTPLDWTLSFQIEDGSEMAKKNHEFWGYVRGQLQEAGGVGGDPDWEQKCVQLTELMKRVGLQI